MWLSDILKLLQKLSHHVVHKHHSTGLICFSDEGRNLNLLDDFMECLSKFTRYNSVRPLATLSYASDLYNGSSIVSRYESKV